MKHYSDPTIQARWSSSSARTSWRILPVLCLAGLAAVCAPAQTQLGPLAVAHHKDPSAETRAALLKFAAEHPRDQDGALALFAVAQADMDAASPSEVAARVTPLQARLPKLGDYLAFLAGNAQSTLLQDDAAMKSLAAVLAFQPRSPLFTRAAVLYAKAAVRSNQAGKALELLKRHYNDLQQPAGDLALAEAFEAARDLVSASNYFQRVYTNSPETREAAEAESALVRLKTQLGQGYPPIMPAAAMARATRLLELGLASRARNDFESILPALAGSDREIAQVRIGGAMLRSGDPRGAVRYLSALNLTPNSEAAAERLFYSTRAAVRADDAGDMMSAIDKLAKSHPKSRWRRDALLAAGDYYFLRMKPGSFGPLYEQCAANFRNEPEAGLCHWRAALAAYQRDRTVAAELFRSHIRNAPAEEHVAASLFHLAQIAESKQDWGVARVFYQEIDYSYPNYYYAFLARERSKDSNIQRAAPSPEAAGFLATVQFPKRRFLEDFRPTPQTLQRSDRAKLLAAAGLDHLADLELRFGSKFDAQPHLMAMDLASLYTQRGQPSVGVRVMKSLATNYLKMPIDSAPREFWKLLFPLPWRDAVELYAKESGVDPYLVAGLIRQESEFDHAVVSRSNAHGLMQIMPATGNELNRRIGLRGYSRLALFDPATNLRLGTFYLNNLFNNFGKKWEETLAGYNAGPGRVRSWLGSSPASIQPWEWVETIPFNETRGYVQSVLRNADTYRKLYSGTPGDSTPAPPIETFKVKPVPETPRPKPAATKRPAGKPASNSRKPAASSNTKQAPSRKR